MTPRKKYFAPSWLLVKPPAVRSRSTRTRDRQVEEAGMAAASGVRGRGFEGRWHADFGRKAPFLFILLGSLKKNMIGESPQMKIALE